MCLQNKRVLKLYKGEGGETTEKAMKKIGLCYGCGHIFPKNAEILQRLFGESIL